MVQGMLSILFGSKLRASLLGWMMMHASDRFFVRQLTAILKEDSTNVSRELARLAKMGILTSRQEGRQKYYQVNQECFIYPELRGLVLKTEGVGDVLRSALAPISDRIMVAFIYGSFARGEEGKGSDVDIFLLGSVTFAEIISALSLAQQDLGREINPTVYPLMEFRSKLSAQNHFLTSVMNEPKVFLVGDEDELAKLAR